MKDEFEALMDDQPGSPTGTAHRMVGTPETVPTMFADTALFAYRFGGTVRVQFVEMNNHAVDSSDPGLTSRHTFNLVMPVEGFSNFLEYLNKTAREWNLPDVGPGAGESANG